MGFEDIIEQPFNTDAIDKMLERKEINRVEWFLLYACRNKNYVNKFLLGIGEYKVYYDSTVPEGLYFNNIDAVLDAFYSVYTKYPNYHIDKVLERALNDATIYQSDVYELSTIINEHILNVEKGIATFDIDKTVMLNNIKDILEKDIYINMIAELTREENSGKNDYEMIKEYNETFKKYGFNIIRDDSKKVIKGKKRMK